MICACCRIEIIPPEACTHVVLSRTNATVLMCEDCGPMFVAPTTDIFAAAFRFKHEVDRA